VGGALGRLSTRGSSQRALYLCCLAGGTSHQHTAYLKWLEAGPEYYFKIASIKNTCLRYVLHTSRPASCTHINDAPYTRCHKSTETTVLMVTNRVAFQRLADSMDPEAYASDLGRAVRQTAGTPEVPTQGRAVC
jgi:hypothetical protein